MNDNLSEHGSKRQYSKKSDGVKKNNPKPSIGQLVGEIAGAIQQKERFAQDQGGKLYHYSGGTYRQRGEQFVKRCVRHYLIQKGRVSQWSTHLANETVEFIRLDSPELLECPPGDVLNLQNGLLRLADHELLPHSPGQLTTIQLPVKYDPKATCPRTEEFVETVFPSDARQLAWEIAGWLISPDLAIQKAVMLIGEGGNGKSRQLAQWRALLGSRNSVAVPLHKLEENRFSAARLYGKLVNICADLPSRDLMGTSVFKAAVDGSGDLVCGEYKHGAEFEFKPFCRFLFSANSPPKSQDPTDGFYDKWVVLPFSNRLRGTDAEINAKTLDMMLSTPQELSGLLNKALEARESLVERGRFSEPESTTKAFLDFRSTTDPFSVWLNQFTVDGPDTLVPVSVLRSAYGADCERRGRPTMTKTAFGNAVRKARPNVATLQRTVNGKLQWCYIGVGLSPTNTDYVDSGKSPYLEGF